eukprot:1860170-Rhodomonas_salina.2
MKREAPGELDEGVGVGESIQLVPKKRAITKAPMKRDANWIKQHPKEAAGSFADEGLLWVTGCCDKNLAEASAAQVDAALLAALALASGDRPGAWIQHGRWFGDIRARKHRHDLRLRMEGAVQQVVRKVASSLRHVLTEIVTDAARLCELACIIVDPGAPAQALHYDTPLLEGEPALVTIFVPLQDISEAMGATCLLPGTHTSVEAHTAYLAAADKAVAAAAAADAAAAAAAEAAAPGDAAAAAAAAAQSPTPDYLGTTLLKDPARGCRVFEGNLGACVCVDA